MPDTERRRKSASGNQHAGMMEPELGLFLLVLQPCMPWLHYDLHLAESSKK